MLNEDFCFGSNAVVRKKKTLFKLLFTLLGKNLIFRN